MSNAIDRTAQEEYALARKEGRQPLCVYCGEPLEVIQRQGESIHWNWNDEKKCYVKGIYGEDADKPYCVECGIADYDFIDNVAGYERTYGDAFIAY